MQKGVTPMVLARNAREGLARKALPLLVAAVTLALGLPACRSSRSKPELEPFEIRLTPAADAYPDVDAVVLIDRGTLTFLRDPRGGPPIARLRQHRQLKVLREPTSTFSVRLRRPPESAIVDLVARVVAPSGAEQELPRRMDLREVRDGRHRRFEVLSFPMAAAGFVVEYAYDLYLKDARFIEPWVFADAYPVVRSEFAVVVPHGVDVDLRYSVRGAFERRPPERFEHSEGTRYVWAEANLTALFPEPGMPDPWLTAPRAHVFFLRWRDKSGLFDGFASWDDVRRWLDAARPRTDLDADGNLSLDGEQVSPLRETAIRWAGEGDTKTRALRLFATITSVLLDEPVESLQEAAMPEPLTILQEGRANVFAQGDLLATMLTAADIPATRALVARRDHDVLLADVPNPLAAESIAAVVPLGPRQHLVLDPAFRTSGPIPPAPLQGTRMIVLDSDGAVIEHIPASDKNDSGCRIRYDLAITTTGDLEGDMNAHCFGALAAQLLDRLSAPQSGPSEPPGLDAGVVSFLREQGARYPIESVTVATPNTPGAPLVVQAKVQRNAMTRDDNDGMRLEMSAFIGGPEDSVREFRRTARIFGAPSETEIRIELELPLNMSISSIPEAAQEAWPRGAMALEVQAVSPRHLSIRRTLTRTALEVSAADWPVYRDFARRVLHRCRQPILIETTL
ncbi:MAG: DUF3857 domain-containing protein [Deltaproteobacteria bacterium]|nr:DUF3857 domain-containing protein [Deltaproteobacteria bacterium]